MDTGHGYRTSCKMFIKKMLGCKNSHKIYLKYAGILWLPLVILGNDVDDDKDDDNDDDDDDDYKMMMMMMMTTTTTRWRLH